MYEDKRHYVIEFKASRYDYDFMIAKSFDFCGECFSFCDVILSNVPFILSYKIFENSILIRKGVKK